MVVVKGTNAGFVTEAPIADPGGFPLACYARAIAIKDVSPAGAGKVTEIGWWCDDAPEDVNFEVAIYNHDVGNDLPEDIVGSDKTNALGAEAGWKRVTGLNIVIIGGTIYWLAVQVDFISDATKIDYTSDGERSSTDDTASTTLTDPWSHTADAFSSIKAIYAVYEAEAPPVRVPRPTVAVGNPLMF